MIPSQNRHVDGANKTEVPNIHTHNYSYLILDKEAKALQYGALIRVHLTHNTWIQVNDEFFRQRQIKKYSM